MIEESEEEMSIVEEKSIIEENHVAEKRKVCTLYVEHKYLTLFLIVLSLYFEDILV